MKWGEFHLVHPTASVSYFASFRICNHRPGKAVLSSQRGPSPPQENGGFVPGEQSIRTEESMSRVIRVSKQQQC